MFYLDNPTEPSQLDLQDKWGKCHRLKSVIVLLWCQIIRRWQRIRGGCGGNLSFDFFCCSFWLYCFVIILPQLMFTAPRSLLLWPVSTTSCELQRKGDGEAGTSSHVNHPRFLPFPLLYSLMCLCVRAWVHCPGFWCWTLRLGHADFIGVSFRGGWRSHVAKASAHVVLLVRS